MKILIIEDDRERSKIIYDISIGQNSSNIAFCAHSFSEAQEAIGELSPDVLIVDVNIPWSPKTEEATSEASLAILKIYRDRILSGACRLVVISGDSQSLRDFSCDRNWVKAFLVACDSDQNWQSSLSRILDSFGDHMIAKDNESADILFVAAMKDPELDALLSNGWCWQSKFEPEILHYLHRCEFVDKSGCKKSAAAIACRNQGAIAAAAVVSTAVKLIRPKLVIMVGICAGIRKKVELGDIIVTTKSWDYSSGKITKTKDGSPVFEAAPDEIPIRPDLLAHLEKLIGENWIGRITPHPEGFREANDVKAILGPTATGPIVSANETIPQYLKTRDRKVIGIEMEIHGVFYAVANTSGRAAGFLAVKSVVDFGDSRKNDTVRNWCANNSASFATWLAEFGSGLLY